MKAYPHKKFPYPLDTSTKICYATFMTGNTLATTKIFGSRLKWSSNDMILPVGVKFGLKLEANASI